MVGCHYYVGTVDGELAVHLGVSTKNKGKAVEARACRLVTMPEWQGAGVGFRFLNHVAQMQMEGSPDARLANQVATTIFHTSHPQLCSVLRRDQRWRQLSGELVGGSKAKSSATMAGSNLSAKTKAGAFPNARLQAKAQAGIQGDPSGYGGHFRAVQGFRWYGQYGLDAAKAKAGR